MAFEFPSQNWADAYKDAINASEAYKKAAKDWTHGKVAYVVAADPSIGLTEDTAMVMDLDQGSCRDIRVVPASEAADMPFIVQAKYPQWKQVMKREIDPTKALMQGRLKLAKGHMPTMVKYVLASKALVDCTANVPTKFRDEA
jgi:putative sterol carrier protein